MAFKDAIRETRLTAALDKIRAMYPEDQDRILSYTQGVRGGGGPRIRFVCKGCENVTETAFRARRHDKPLECESCIQSRAMKAKHATGKLKDSPRNQPTDIEEVRALFRERGAEPTFTEYRNAAQQLTFICTEEGCSNSGQMSYRNLKFQDPRTTVVATPRCPACSKLARRKWAKEKAAQHFPHPTGPDHPRWDPNLTDQERALNDTRGPAFIAWARAVKERDRFCCAVTPLLKQGAAVESHHLYSWSDYPKRRFDLRNGVTLSVAAHARFHARYGRKGNTFAQFAEFYMAETGRPCPFVDPYGE